MPILRNITVLINAICCSSYSYSPRWKWLRNLIAWKYCRDYFPARLVKTADLDPNRNYICGSHPHGLVCFGASLLANTPYLDTANAFPNIFFRLLTLREFYFLPGMRELMLGAGKHLLHAFFMLK